VRKCSKILHKESKLFVGNADTGHPYSSDRDLTDDALRAHLKDLKKRYPKFKKLSQEKKK